MSRMPTPADPALLCAPCNRLKLCQLDLRTHHGKATRTVMSIQLPPKSRTRRAREASVAAASPPPFSPSLRRRNIWVRHVPPHCPGGGAFGRLFCPPRFRPRAPSSTKNRRSREMVTMVVEAEPTGLEFPLGGHAYFCAP